MFIHFKVDLIVYSKNKRQLAAMAICLIFSHQFYCFNLMFKNNDLIIIKE